VHWVLYFVWMEQWCKMRFQDSSEVSELDAYRALIGLVSSNGNCIKAFSRHMMHCFFPIFDSLVMARIDCVSGLHAMPL
jgi:hypothetical protein